ncbi:MAG: DUF4143 domain-containing protein [Burkholderiaceae bacterium]|nr:DUF4143 domain-containing protein [Burkholderiaceae bacterium]
MLIFKSGLAGSTHSVLDDSVKRFRFKDQKPNRLKLFLFDTGLLNHMLGSSYQQIKRQAYGYKGFVAENFVQQELAVLGIEPTHAWFDVRVEIEFLLTTPLGEIVTVEVKSGVRTRARSLAS